MIIKIYNTLTRQIEEFKPVKKGEVGLYACGPTVYNYAHIGNLRAYVFEDILKRVLEYNNFKVKHVMNITDVGHLTDDGDEGEDKLEKGSRREGKSAWEVAEFYTEAFLRDLEKLNISLPNFMPRATGFIGEQIDLIKILEKKGYTYKTSDGIYFDTSKFENYNKLNHKNLEDLQEGARVEINPEKKNPTDFALWKFSADGEKRQMEWESPWGVGFPGWHIECSAMSMALLEEQTDVHCGGVDHIDVHHTNEIAQSEVATGKKFFNYWMHGAFLNIAGGKKMAKSEDNFLTLANAFEKKGLDPLAFRFACLQVSYRKPMEYSPEAMQNAQNGFSHLQNQVKELGETVGTVSSEFREFFLEAINDDLSMPGALAVCQKLLKSDLAGRDKLATILDFDRVLGLGLSEVKRDNEDLSEEIQDLIRQRDEARSQKDWEKSDDLREELEKAGFTVEDGKEGTRVLKK